MPAWIQTTTLINFFDCYGTNLALSLTSPATFSLTVRCTQATRSLKVRPNFENLGQPSNYNFDASFFHQINEELKKTASQYEEQPDTTLSEISEEEFYKAIWSLQLGTPSGPDQIQTEHIC